jgi:hypothetical protein
MKFIQSQLLMLRTYSERILITEYDLVVSVSSLIKVQKEQT